MQDAFNQKVVEYKQKGIDIDQQTLDFLKAQLEEQHAMNEMIELQEGLRSSLQQGMAAGFEGLITGTKSVKQAFSDMATGILKMLAQMISQMLAARILMSIFGLAMPGLSFGGAQGQNLVAGVGDVGSRINTDAGNISAGLFRYGGISEPGGYSTGGIARGSQAGYPAILHGTEAVVPLPNGKSIPVEMNNSQATSNNSVVVNVAMGEGTSKQSQGESQGANSSQLGRLIAGAVQRELQEQQRPGGILSPYGAAR